MKTGLDNPLPKSLDDLYHRESSTVEWRRGHNSMMDYPIFRRYPVLDSPFVHFMLVVFTFGLFGGGGCTTAVESGQNTALTGLDLKRMTAKMAASLASSAAVQEAIRANGHITVVVEPVQNEMTAEILPTGQAQAFTSRVRILLSEQNPNQFVWVLNRDDFYDLRQRETDLPLGPAPDAVSPDYALTAYFRTLTNENSHERSSSYLCVYELSNLKDRSVIWTDKYEVDKSAVKGFLD